MPKKEDRDQMNNDLSLSEVKAAIDNLNLKSAGGPSGVCSALFKWLFQIIPDFILLTLNDL